MRKLGSCFLVFLFCLHFAAILDAYAATAQSNKIVSVLGTDLTAFLDQSGRIEIKEKAKGKILLSGIVNDLYSDEQKANVIAKCFITSGSKFEELASGPEKGQTLLKLKDGSKLVGKVIECSKATLSILVNDREKKVVAWSEIRCVASPFFCTVTGKAVRPGPLPLELNVKSVITWTRVLHCARSCKSPVDGLEFVVFPDGSRPFAKFQWPYENSSANPEVYKTIFNEPAIWTSDNYLGYFTCSTVSTDPRDWSRSGSSTEIDPNLVSEFRISCPVFIPPGGTIEKKEEVSETPCPPPPPPPPKDPEISDPKPPVGEAGASLPTEGTPDLLAMVTPNATGTAKVLSLEQAQKSGLCDIAIRSNDDPNHCDVLVTSKQGAFTAQIAEKVCFLSSDPASAQNLMEATDPIFKVPAGQTVTVPIETYCISTKSISPPPAKGLKYTVGAYPDSEIYKRLVGIAQNAAKLDKEGRFNDVPVSAEKRARKIAQTAIWLYLGKHSSKKADLITAQSLKADLLKSGNLSKEKLTAEQLKKVEEFARLIFSAANTTVRELSSGK